MKPSLETFFTSIGCMDGRVQDVVAAFGRHRFGVQFADTITEAGLVGILGKNDVDDDLLESLRNKIVISLEKHHSLGIVVHGHQECAGNPVSDEQQKNDIRQSIAAIRLLTNPSVPIVGAFIKCDGSMWVVEEVSPTLTA